MEFFFWLLLLNKGREHSNQEQTFKWCPSTSCRMQQFTTEKTFFFRACKSFLQQSKSMQSCKKLQELITFFLISIKILIISHF